MGPESIVRIGRDGAVLLAERGRVTVSGSADTGILVAVVAENESGSPDWRLDLAVSAQGRVESGELVEDGTTWTIQAQTGLIASQIDTQFVDVESDRAVTVRSSAAGPNVPMTFRIVGRTS
ncbi:MAG: hypothetical protein HQ526_07640 [Actinobacteria bacterium]|nr:hypothetical protein [Actinomycetota bacterium]